MKTTKTVINTALGVLAALLVIIGMVCMLARFYIMDTERYERYILTDKYFATVYQARDDGFDSFGSVIEADSAKLKSFFSDDMCKNLATEYVRAVFYDMKNDTKTANYVVAESDGLKAYLTELFKGYDFSSTEYASTEAAVDSAYKLICDDVNDAVRFMPDKLMGALTDVIAPFWALVDGVVKYWALFFMAAALLYAVMAFLSDKKRISQKLFGAASSFWCACACVFIPIGVLFAGTSGISVDLDKNALLYFLDGFINSLREGMFYTTLVFALIATALLVAALVLSIREEKHVADTGPMLAADK